MQFAGLPPPYQYLVEVSQAYPTDLTLSLPQVTKTEFLQTISKQYQNNTKQTSDENKETISMMIISWPNTKFLAIK